MIKLAGCVIRDETERILLLHRDNGRHLHWELPGGKIDKGEQPDETAIREIKEELGVRVELAGKIGETEFEIDKGAAHYTWFGAKVIEGKPKIMEPETFDDLRYFSITEMRTIYKELSPSAQNLLAVLEV